MSLRSIIGKIPFLKKCVKNTYIQKKASIYKKASDNSETDFKLVVFESFQGRSYSCSPKAIYEYMLSDPDFADYRYVWIFRDTSIHGDFPENTRLLKFDSDDSLKAYAQAGTWIVNSRLRDFIEPRPEQKYIQCWHGTPFKKIGCDVTCAGNATSTVEEIHSEYAKDAEKIYKFISPGKFTTEKLISAFDLKKFGKEDRIIEQGYPRNDALFNTPPEAVEKIKAELNIPPDKKVVLYCPTYRDNQFNSDGYSLKIGMDLDALKNKLENDAVILFRAHYFIADKFDFEKYNNFIIDVSNHDDINQLFLASDLLITDYSSVFFDYANLNRPIIFYHYDLEEYKNNMRDFYFGTAMLPGIVINEQEKLEIALSAIINDLKKGGNGLGRYAAALSAFNKRFNPMEDGKSAERTVNAIFKT